MSFDGLLLRARGLGKVYPSPLAPMARLKQELFGIAPPADKSHCVLQDLDLEVFRGETLGIMGRNGAGKSTLLGILGNVIEPSSGSVERHGKIAVLLEVGGGFHASFTGRDNAKLFCSVMGMTARETEERIGGIEAFADIGDYFDLPLRIYSSGMQARLGFACAVYVDADLVIIDETLAVGDALFRMRCYDRIRAMQKRGLTFLMVSHSPQAVASFCTRTLVLEKGRKVFDGSVADGIASYKEIREGLAEKPLSLSKKPTVTNAPGEGRLDLRGLSYSAATERGEPVGIIQAELVAREDIERPFINFGIRDRHGLTICGFEGSREDRAIPPMRRGEQRPVRMRFKNILLPGVYFVSFKAGRMLGDAAETTCLLQDAIRIDIEGRGAGGFVDLEMGLEVGADSSELETAGSR